MVVRQAHSDLEPAELLLVAIAEQARLDAGSSRTLVGLPDVTPARSEAIRREASEFLRFLAAELAEGAADRDAGEEWSGARWRKMAHF